MQVTSSQFDNSGIFIVGMPLSGADILSKLLNSHSKVACGPETHFYDQLDPRDVNEALEDPQWPKKASNLIATLQLNKRQVLSAYGLTPSHVYQYLIKKSPSRSNMLLAIQELYIQGLDKQFWIEKTPEHLLQVNAILQDFPDAKIILITRDPRDLAKSMVGLPQAYHSVHANAAKLALLHQKSLDSELEKTSILTVKYENLLSDLETTLKKVCLHIGIDCEPKMLINKNISYVTSWEESIRRDSQHQNTFATSSEKPANKQFEPQLFNVAFTCKHYIENFEYSLNEGSQTVIDYPLESNLDLGLQKGKKLGLIVSSQSKFTGLDSHLMHVIPSRCQVFLYRNQASLKQSGQDLAKENCLLLFLEGSPGVKCKLLLKALKAKFWFGHKIVYLHHQPKLGWWDYLLSVLFIRC